MPLLREARPDAPALSSVSEALPPLYRHLRAGARHILDGLFELEVVGLEQMPAQGPYIVAANHHNYLDGIVLAATIPQRIAFLVMPRVYHATPLHPAFHRWAGTIPLSLERPDVGAIRRALRVLERGGVVGIFPEGPFSVKGRLERGQPGVALLALRSGAPVVPVAIRGTYEALIGRRFYIPRVRPLRVTIGAPRVISGTRHPGDKALREDATRRIMADIADLLS